MAVVPPIPAGQERAGNVAKTADKCTAHLAANAALVSTLLAGARAAESSEAQAASAGEKLARDLRGSTGDESCPRLKAALDTFARELAEIQDARRKLLVSWYTMQL